MGGGRESVIDFMLISRKFAFLVDSFEVEPNSASDHNPITASLRVTAQEKKGDGRPLQYNSNQGVRLKWSKINPLQFEENIVKANLSSILKCLHHDSPPDMVIQGFQLICRVVSKSLIKSLGRREAQETKWINAECSRAQKDLKKALHAIPRDKILIKNVRQAYKSTINERNDKLRRLAWENLERASALKDTKSFWEIINRPYSRKTRGV